MNLENIFNMNYYAWLNIFSGGTRKKNTFAMFFLVFRPLARFPSFGNIISVNITNIDRAIHQSEMILMQSLLGRSTHDMRRGFFSLSFSRYSFSRLHDDDNMVRIFWMFNRMVRIQFMRTYQVISHFWTFTLHCNLA